MQANPPSSTEHPQISRNKCGKHRKSALLASGKLLRVDVVAIIIAALIFALLGTLVVGFDRI